MSLFSRTHRRTLKPSAISFNHVPSHTGLYNPRLTLSVKVQHLKGWKFSETDLVNTHLCVIENSSQECVKWLRGKHVVFFKIWRKKIFFFFEGLWMTWQIILHRTALTVKTMVKESLSKELFFPFSISVRKMALCPLVKLAQRSWVTEGLTYWMLSNSRIIFLWLQPNEKKKKAIKSFSSLCACMYLLVVTQGLGHMYCNRASLCPLWQCLEFWRPLVHCSQTGDWHETIKQEEYPQYWIKWWKTAMLWPKRATQQNDTTLHCTEVRSPGLAPGLRQVGYTYNYSSKIICTSAVATCHCILYSRQYRLIPFIVTAQYEIALL